MKTEVPNSKRSEGLKSETRIIKSKIKISVQKL